MESKIQYHPQRTEIEKDIIDGVPFREIAKKYSSKSFKLSRETIRRYKENSLPSVMRYSQVQHADGVARIATDCMTDLESVRQAAINALQDPDNPGQININPSAKEMKIRWYDSDTKKYGVSSLKELLDKIPDEKEVQGIYGNAKDPRTLLLDTTEKMLKCMELISKTQGFISDGTTVNITNTNMTTSEIADMTEKALSDYPEALDAWTNAFLEWCAQRNEDARKAIEYSKSTGIGNNDRKS